VLQAVGTPGGYAEKFGEKSFSIYMELFSFYQKWVSTPLRQTFGKWDLREKYDGSNLGEKGF
jgi:hypothetical protein